MMKKLLILVAVGLCGCPTPEYPYSGPEESYPECLNPNGRSPDDISFRLGKTTFTQDGPAIEEWSNNTSLRVVEGFQGGRHLEFGIIMEGPTFQLDQFGNTYEIEPDSSHDQRMIAEMILTRDGEEIQRDWSIIPRYVDRFAVDEENETFFSSMQLVLAGRPESGPAELTVEIDLCDAETHETLVGELEIQ